ncbi:MAG: phosphoribosylaminoimidazolesuccinocarboxamide synthase [Faecalibacterium sp.]
MAYVCKEQLYEGKAKQVFLTNDPEVVMVHYKDDATAGDGAKKGTIRDKGIVNNKLSNALMQKLEKEGIPTHFVEEVNDRDAFVKKVSIVPLEVIIRNVAAGSFSKRFGVKEGTILNAPTVEFSYKNDDLHDPLMNTYHALALELATKEEIEQIEAMAFKVNEILKEIMMAANIRLIDFKLEFGRLADGTIILADEISPDTCRYWDATTGEHLDKDLFRRDLGGEEDAYQEVMKRILG